MKSTIGTKLGISFGVVLVLMAFSALFSYITVQQLTGKAIPLKTHCDEMIINVQTSLTDLRSYMILGDEELTSDRSLAWKRIDAAAEELDSLKTTAMNARVRATWSDIYSELETLRNAQKKYRIGCALRGQCCVEKNAPYQGNSRDQQDARRTVKDDQRRKHS